MLSEQVGEIACDLDPRWSGGREYEVRSAILLREDRMNDLSADLIVDLHPGPLELVVPIIRQDLSQALDEGLAEVGEEVGLHTIANVTLSKLLENVSQGVGIRAKQVHHGIEHLNHAHRVDEHTHASKAGLAWVLFSVEPKDFHGFWFFLKESGTGP